MTILSGSTAIIIKSLIFFFFARSISLSAEQQGKKKALKFLLTNAFMATILQVLFIQTRLQLYLDDPRR